ncbi:MAG: rRNA maturation RNase YbeY [Clostridia bacterium]|nr:rRNA maturation RNase YbeY [Clostridia bacterium]
MSLKVYYTNEQDRIPVDIALRNLVRRSVLAALGYEGFLRDCEVSVTFTDNEGIRELNREYREKDSATDVLSFPMYDFPGGDVPEEGFPCELGDIVLSLERAEEQAAEFGHSFKREVAFLTVHSTLHLLGYDHELSDEDDADMRRRQKEIMEILKITRD